MNYAALPVAELRGLRAGSQASARLPMGVQSSCDIALCAMAKR